MRGKQIYYNPEGVEIGIFEGYWRAGAYFGKGRFISHQPKEKRTCIFDGSWFDNGNKFKGKVTINENVIEEVIMLFDPKMEVILKGEKKSSELGLLVSESGDIYSGKITKGRIDGLGL